MQIDVVTLFPKMFDAITESGVTGRARERRAYQFLPWNPRDFAANTHRTVDDRPYGGGPGMVMMAEPLEKAVCAARQRQISAGVSKPLVIYLSPQGRLLKHEKVVSLAAEQGIVLLAGRYEGVDERLIARQIDEEISIGDFVLSGGEVAAMALMDAVIRQLPGVLGDTESAQQDSFVGGLLDWPHYTRPEVYEGVAVPPELMSGNHADIVRWRLQQSLGRTQQRRPDLMAERGISTDERVLLEKYLAEAAQLEAKAKVQGAGK
ncbi:MAG TPA: tRNA (guanosine(37)-N1)-methyltransferase TrmD [Burkholderiales bacterium]|nr:tRNA (guanosine(37)-N1)-methyltransferase TrmD [Burkholderiales bacterium]